ncbi:hypothetical protein [Paenibacillus odorifer]|uniref:hypothetical protein n=1 Tax=Paenibacillus odorifer TaxID=189426 RepID=UPI0013A6CF8A|nr:hypothetical protein [Paenibacillus odorifer]
MIKEREIKDCLFIEVIRFLLIDRLFNASSIIAIAAFLTFVKRIAIDKTSFYFI